jgi:hypothetical protein
MVRTLPSDGFALWDSAPVVDSGAVMDLAQYLEADVEPETPGGCLVVMCAALGSPVSELSLVLDVERDRLRAAVHEGEPLPSFVFDVASMWVACLWWRTLWRLGHETAHETREVDAASLLASSLPFVPDDWQADHGRAVILRERREVIPWPTRQRGEDNGRSKLTQRKVDEMRRRSSDGATLRELSSTFGVSPSRVHRIVAGDAW